MPRAAYPLQRKKDATMRRRRLLGLFSGLCVLLRLAYSGEALDERVQLTSVLRVQWSDAQGAQGSDGFSVRLARLGARFQVDEQTTGNLLVEFASGEAGRAADLLDAFVAWRPRAEITVFVGQMLAPLFLRCARADCDS